MWAGAPTSEVDSEGKSRSGSHVRGVGWTGHRSSDGHFSRLSRPAGSVTGAGSGTRSGMAYPLGSVTDTGNSTLCIRDENWSTSRFWFWLWQELTVTHGDRHILRHSVRHSVR